MTHRQVGRAGLRPRGLTGRRPGKVDRLLGHGRRRRTRPGHDAAAGLAPAGLELPGARHGLPASARCPGRAADEVLALAAFVAHPGRIRDLRTRTATIDPAPGTGEVVAGPPPAVVEQPAGRRRGASAAPLSERYRSVAGERRAASPRRADRRRVQLASPRSGRATSWLSPVRGHPGAAVVASLVAARGLIGLGALAAPVLLPAHDSARGAVAASVWDPIPGAPGQSSPPWLALAALGSTVLAGPAGVVHHPAGLRRGPAGPARGLPGGPAGGQRPAAAAVGRRDVRAAPRAARAAPTRAGSRLSVVAIALPLLVQARPRSGAAPRADARGLARRLGGRGGPGRAGRLRAVVAASRRCCSGWRGGRAAAYAAQDRPDRHRPRPAAAGAAAVVAEPDRRAGPAASSGPTRRSAARRPAPASGACCSAADWAPGCRRFWLGAVVFGVIWVVAAGRPGPPPGSTSRGGRLGDRAAALALAVALSRLVVTVPPVGHRGAALGGLLSADRASAPCWSAAASASTDVGRATPARSFTWLQPVVGAGRGRGRRWSAWVGRSGGCWAGAQGPIDRTQLDAIPPYVLNAMAHRRPAPSARAGPVARHRPVRRARRRDSSGSATPTGVTPSAARRRPRAGGRPRRPAGGGNGRRRHPATARRAGHRLSCGSPGRARTHAPGSTTRRASARPAATSRATVWQLQPAVARTVLADEAAQVALAGPPATVPPGADGRQLRIGEAADPRWRAELDGRALPAVAAGWQQAFALGPAGGSLGWALPSRHGWLLIGQGLVLLVAAVLAAPGVRRPEVRDPTKAAKRSATLSEPV